MLTPSDELAELQVPGRGMIRRETARDPLKPLALERPDGTRKRGRFDDGPELPEIGRDVLADRLEIGGVGRAGPCAPDTTRGRCCA